VTLHDGVVLYVLASAYATPAFVVAGWLSSRYPDFEDMPVSLIFASALWPLTLLVAIGRRIGR
jgi:hypothetical protein